MLDAIGIACKSVDESVSFYSHFGLSFKKLGDGHYEGVSKSGLRIMLDSFELMKTINPRWKEPGICGFTLCFKQSSVAEVNKLCALLTEANYKVVKAPWDAFWGQRYASVLDPNGNQVDLFADQPV